MLDLTLIQYGGLNQMILRLRFFSSFNVVVEVTFGVNVKFPVKPLFL